MRNTWQGLSLSALVRGIPSTARLTIALTWLVVVGAGLVDLGRFRAVSNGGLQQALVGHGYLSPRTFAIVVAALALMAVLAVLVRSRPRDVLPAILIAVIVICTTLLATSGQLGAGFVVLALGLTAELLGLVILDQLRITADAVLAAAIALPLGLGLLALVILGIGLISGLTTPIITTLIVVVAGSSVYLQRRRLRGLRATLIAGWNNRPEVGPLATGCLVILALFFVLTWIGALAPETGADPLQDHLQLARRFAAEGRVIAIPTMVKYYWSLNAEMIYTAAYSLAGETAAKLVHFWAAAATAFLVFAMGRTLSSPRLGLLAATVFYTTPVVSWEAGSTDIDLMVTLFCAAALALLLLRQAGQRTRGVTVAIGVSLGLGVGAKWSAGFFAVAVVVWLLVDAYRSRDYRSFLAALSVGSVALLVALPWLLRAYVLAGNPVFPFLNGVFRSPLWYPSSEFFNLSDFGTERSLAGIASLPWQITYHTSLFMEAPDGIVGIVYLGFVPLVLLAIKSAARYAAVAFVTILFAVLMIAFTEYLRYMLPALVGLALLAAWGAATAQNMGRQSAPRLAAIIPLAFLVFVWLNLPLALREAGYNVPLDVVLGRVPRETYRALQLRGYRTFQYINAHLSSTDRIYVVRENYDYLSDVPLIEPFYSLDANRIFRAASPDALREALAQACPTYLLITNPDRLLPNDAVLPHTRLLLDYAHQNAVLVYSDDAEELYRTPSEIGDAPGCRGN